MNETRQQIGERLRQARIEADLKQEQVARYLKVNVSAVSGLENGQRKLDSVELFYLSKLYGKPLDWFFSEGHPLTNQGSRWYDNDPLVREAIFLLKKASPDLRKKAAYGILGFLSDR